MKAATPANRAPRGTKPVTQAFFTALDTIPEATRAAVGKFALAAIRDEMKAQKEKMRVVVAKEKEKAKLARRPAKAAPAKAAPAKATPAKAAPVKAAPAKSTAKTSKAKPAARASKANGAAEHEAPAPKRRSRKPAEAVTAE